MSRDARISLDFAGEEREFRLGYRELIDLQESLDAGPWFLLAQFMGLGQMLLNPASVKDLGVKIPREVIRIGLIGGGMKPPDALRLVRTYVEARPPDESVPVAFEVLKAGLNGAPEVEDEIKKKTEQPSPSQTFPEERSASPL